MTLTNSLPSDLIHAGYRLEEDPEFVTLYKGGAQVAVFGSAATMPYIVMAARAHQKAAAQEEEVGQ